MTCSKRIQQRLALYQGVCPIYMEFTDDAETSFSNALTVLQVMLCWNFPRFMRNNLNWQEPYFWLFIFKKIHGTYQSMLWIWANLAMPTILKPLSNGFNVNYLIVSTLLMYFLVFHIQKQGMVKEGEEVALVQSGRQPIWRIQSTHNIQVRKV